MPAESVFETTMIRPRLLAVALALALTAGPVAAACADCCPRTEGPLSLAAAADCCGDCPESLERAPERPSATLRALSPGAAPAAAVSLALAAVPRPVPALAGILAAVRPPDSPPPPAFAPLRL